MLSESVDLWEDLLLALEDGQVVPIVGRDLLTIDTDAGPCLLHHAVARRLAAELRVDVSALPPGFDTNDVICAYDGFHGDPMSINPRVVRILKAMQPAAPEVLRQLASIPTLKLFVSTTYDTLLEDAIAEVRGRKPTVISFPPSSSLTDLDDAFFKDGGTVVFQILGRATASSPFALTEGQVLEQMHELMSGDMRPERLIARLRQSHLLMLGVNLPDWLGRFLLRDARGKPLWDSRSIMEIIVDSGAERAGFAGFVQRFSPQQSRMVTAESPSQMVRSLAERWVARHPERATAPPLAAAAEKPEPMSAGAVFVSYASEDREAAFRLADELTRGGLDVWIDRRISPGADYRDLIERHIRECAAFVPALSRHTQTDDERWFRREWAQACDRARQYFGTDRVLIFPVVIDHTPNGELTELRRETFGRSAVRAEGGVPPPNLVAELDRAQKAWRRQFGR